MPYQRTIESASFEIDGTKLRILRKNRGETLSQFAARADISLGYLSQLERGTKPGVGIAVFRRICDALGYQTERERISLLSAAARKRAEHAMKAAA